MSDVTYNTKVYLKQGGEELVVASGGKITVEAGGSIEGAGATYTVTNPDNSTIEVNSNALRIKPGGVLAASLGVTAGTASASKAVVLGADKSITGMFYIVPSTDPAIAGALWNDAGTLKVSAG